MSTTTYLTSSLSLLLLHSYNSVYATVRRGSQNSELGRFTYVKFLIE